MSGLPGFTAVKDVRPGVPGLNLLGVVVDLQHPSRTRGTDWALNFTIQDDFSAGSVGGSSSLSCRVFKPSQASLPKIAGPGDVVILRNFKLSVWNTRSDCVSNPASAVLVFPAAKIPVPEFSQAYMLGGRNHLPYEATVGAREPSAAEERAVLALKHSSSSSARALQEHASTASLSTSKRKEALIQDLTFDKYSDIKAEVLNIYYSNYGTVELKVTDYTTNKLLYLYADPDRDPDMVFKREWPGPFGQVTLEVRLYDAHAAWARDHLKNGDFVFLKNVYTKFSPRNVLEGSMHKDQKKPDQVDVRKLSDTAAIEAIKQRKHAYEQQRLTQRTVHLANVPKKASAKASARRKAEKRQRQRQQKEAELKAIEEKEEGWEAERSGVNRNIRAGFPEKQCSTISEIINNPFLQTKTATKHNPLTLPFVNSKHRARVRAVDFFPPELEYFTHSLHDPNWTPCSKKDRWEWGFVLLLEDAHVPRDTVPQQLRVLVNNDSAQYLGLPHARDLTADPPALAQLRERLFILWGNLAELKDQLRARSCDLPLPPGDNRLDNRPFDCCIEEYGYEVPVAEDAPMGYQRLHRLAFTKIMS
ncbi:hypothetical protein C7974DRAFT_384646 [Boeremia exigua]|uniref:uncharacterized protein n=1 Tax=Boeremia exigua TaxID=749465 RepID=UPI001E8E5083|nr:uncharacterized protein C7974DRAFT_384646 [Boeremia exigua]KAH6641991.1 hypothetical protein C7974DRAFT_384646 [Boeremia exigua]